MVRGTPGTLRQGLPAHSTNVVNSSKTSGNKYESVRGSSPPSSSTVWISLVCTFIGPASHMSVVSKSVSGTTAEPVDADGAGIDIDVAVPLAPLW